MSHGDLGHTILASAVALASRALTYDADPARRWADDAADCSSFVQRALIGAGVVAFDPGPGHRNAWSARAFATRDDVFVTVGVAEARPGDVLVQGGFATAAVWKGHCGIFRQRSAAHPELLQGVSMGRRGPTVNGLWGADGHYPFGSGLLVRRLRATTRGPSTGDGREVAG